MIYIYKCKNGHETEVNLPMADDKPQEITCEQCGEISRKLFNSTSFKFRTYNRAPDNSSNNLGEDAYH